MQRKSAPETCNSREQSSKLCRNQNLNLSNKLEITAEEIGVAGFSGLRQIWCPWYLFQYSGPLNLKLTYWAILSKQDPLFLNFLLNRSPSADKLEQFFSTEDDIWGFHCSGSIGWCWWWHLFELSRRQMPGEMGAPPFLLIHHPFSVDMSGCGNNQTCLWIISLMKDFDQQLVLAHCL